MSITLFIYYIKNRDHGKLFPHAEILETEILALGRWKLAAPVYPSAQMVYDAVVTILSGCGLAASHELGVTIFVLAGGGNHHHTLEIKLTLVPPLANLGKVHHHIVGHAAMILICGRHRVSKTLLLLEIEHRGRDGLDDDKIDMRTNLVTLREKHITRHIVSDVGLQFRSNVNILNRTQEINSLGYIRDKYLIVKIS